MTNKTNVIEKINKEFPGINAVDGCHFHGSNSDSIWFRGSEGAVHEGLPIYDSYTNDTKLYDFGVLKVFVEYLTTLSYSVENYDAGTLMAYPE